MIPKFNPFASVLPSFKEVSALCLQAAHCAEDFSTEAIVKYKQNDNKNKRRFILIKEFLKKSYFKNTTKFEEKLKH